MKERISKLEMYMQVAEAVSKRSHDSETQVGSVLVNSSGSIIATGHNGFIRGAPDHLIPNTRPEKYDYMVHAETNMFMNCCKHGIATDNCVLICTLSPCTACIRTAWQAGISEIYFKDEYRDFYKSTHMKDLQVETEKVGEYTKIIVSPREE